MIVDSVSSTKNEDLQRTVVLSVGHSVGIWR